MRIRFFTLWIALCLSGGALAFLTISPLSAEDHPPLTKDTVDPHWLALVEASAAITPSLNVDLTTSAVAGRVPLGSPVTLRLTRGNVLVFNQTVTPFPDSQGFFYVGGLGFPSFTAGDILTVTQASTVMTLTLPSLSALAYPESDVVSGTAPINAALAVDVYPSDAPENAQTQMVTATVTGEYQAAFPLRPRDSGYVHYAPQPERQAYVRWVAPFLRVQAGGWPISGYAAPWSGVAVTVYDDGGTQLTGLYASVNGDGSFAIDNYCYYKRPPCPPILRSGYTIVAEAAGQTFSTTVAALTAVADPVAGQITGEAPFNAPVDITVYVGPLSDKLETLAAQMTVTATATGHYTASLPLSRAAYGTAAVTDAGGHETYARFAAPVLGVRLVNEEMTFWNAAMLWGQVNDTQAPITVSIQGSSGYLKDLRLLTTGPDGYFVDGWVSWAHDPPNFPKLEAGDVLTVTTPRGSAMQLTVPLVTAEANTLSGTVMGNAPPNAPLIVTLSDAWSEHWYAQAVTATALGTYTVDFSGQGGFTGYATGEVSLVTAEGHTVTRNFKATSHCAPRFYPVQVGGNALGFDITDNCPGLTLRLSDAGGETKYETLVAAYGKGFYEALVDANGRPVPILPGDQVEVTSANAPTYTLAIPSLTVQLDVAANTITGHAPPGEVVQFWGGQTSSLTTTATAQGVYTITLTEPYTLTPGISVPVLIRNGLFFATERVPVVYTWLGRNDVFGALSPLTPYTLTHSSGFSVSGYAASAGEWQSPLNVNLRPGDEITVTTAAQSISMTIPMLTARFYASPATVIGTAPPNATVRVDLEDYYGRIYGGQVVTTTATGAYTAIFPSITEFFPLYMIVTYANAQGHQTVLIAHRAHWQATLESQCVRGVAPLGETTITIGHQTLDGATNAQTGYADSSGNFIVCFSHPIRAGSLLTLTTITNDVMTFTVPEVTTHHDFGAQTLTGQVVPDTHITVAFQIGQSWNGPIYTFRQTQANASGQYGLDTHGLGLTPGQAGYVVVTDALGSTVRRDFTVTGYLTYLPMIAR